MLLLRRAKEPWKGRWDIPGGFCDADEHPITTAEREAETAPAEWERYEAERASLKSQLGALLASRFRNV